MLVSSVYGWVGKPYVIKPTGLAAARVQIRHLTSKPNLMATVEAVKANAQIGGMMQMSARRPARAHKQ